MVKTAHMYRNLLCEHMSLFSTIRLYDTLKTLSQAAYNVNLGGIWEKNNEGWRKKGRKWKQKCMQENVVTCTAFQFKMQTKRLNLGFTGEF